jgi:hypothetical protein
LNVGVAFVAFDMKWSFNEMSLQYRASQSLVNNQGFSTGTAATLTIDAAQCGSERQILNSQYYVCWKDTTSMCLPPVPWGTYAASKGEQMAQLRHQVHLHSITL